MSTALTNTPNFWPGDSPTPAVGRMSEEEFVEWALDQEFRTEWVDGEVVFMSPANAEHSEIRGWLYFIMRFYVSKHQLGRMLDDVMIRLSKQRRVRVPDLFFVQQSRLDIIGPTSLREPPDLAIEIISPRSSARDWQEKFHEYETFGIAEYTASTQTVSTNMCPLSMASFVPPSFLDSGCAASGLMPNYGLRIWKR